MAIELTTATAEQIGGIQDAIKLSIPVLTEYPTTDATKVGQKFIYKGTEWKYHSQGELDDLGWSSVKSEGFPAPVSKLFNTYIIHSDQDFFIYADNSGTRAQIYINEDGSSGEIDFIGLGYQVRHQKHILFSIRSLTQGSSSVNDIKNADLLLSLEDVGTTNALAISSGADKIGCSAEVINDFFTQLPTTTKTATINVSSFTGAATCDPTIATAKGYTVVT